jgi:DNA invertase Pin-like site-specific DNA recombinase
MAAGGHSGAPSFVSYYRVSTDKQGKSGLGLEAQKATVAQYVASSGGLLVAEFEEIESGKRNDRPKLALALGACRARRATLILAKLDRLARDTAFLLSVVRGAGDAGVVFCDLPQLPPGPAGAFILTMFAAVAELERGLISQRTKSALAAAKARGVKLGGRNLARGLDSTVSRAGRQAQTARSNGHAEDVMPYITAAAKAGATSLRQIAEALTARGIQPPSGGECWHANQVRRIIAKRTIDAAGCDRSACETGGGAAARRGKGLDPHLPAA